MTCPKCNIEMIEGSLYNHGTLWMPRPLKQVGWGLNKVIFGIKFYVQAFRCPQCNKIELVTAEIK